MTIPRELKLRKEREGIRLVQHPVAELSRLRRECLQLCNMQIGPGTTCSPDVSGDLLEIIAEFDPGSAQEFGIKVRKSASQETIVGYDAARKRLFVDRTRSGKSDFHDCFPCRHDAALKTPDNRIRLHVFVDWSSVEVFADGGRLVMTDQIFPDPDSQGVELFADGGTVNVVSLTVYKLQSIHANQPSAV